MIRGVNALVQTEGGLDLALQPGVIHDIVVAQRLLDHQQAVLVQSHKESCVVQGVGRVSVHHQTDVGEDSPDFSNDGKVPARLDLDLDATVAFGQESLNTLQQMRERGLDADADTTLDLVDNTYHKFLIDISSVTHVEFWIDLEDGAGWQHAGTSTMPSATGNLQPYIEQQKDAGTETCEVHIDYVRVAWKRS